MFRGSFNHVGGNERIGFYYGPSGDTMIADADKVRDYWFDLKYIAESIYERLCRFCNFDFKKLRDSTKDDTVHKDTATFALYAPVDGPEKIHVNWHRDFGLVSVALSNQEGFEAISNGTKVQGEPFRMYVHLANWFAQALFNSGTYCIALKHYTANHTNQDRLFVGFFLEPDDNSTMERILIERDNNVKVLTNVTYKQYTDAAFKYVNDNHGQ